MKEKLHEYEQEIQWLKSENEAFSRQIKQLSQFNEPFQTKDLMSNPFFTNAPATQPNLQALSKELGPMNNSFTIPSPIPRQSNVSRVSKDGLFDLENMFLNAEYKKAMEALSQLDYKAPPNISNEKFSRWLAMSNRIKDSQLNEIFLKLKTLTAPNAENGGPEAWEDKERGLEDSFDSPTMSIIDKICFFLDEKIPKIVLHNEYSSKNLQKKDKSPKNVESDYQTAHFKEGEESDREEMQMTEAQLRQKLKYLKGNLQSLETQIRDKEAEVRGLREKMGESTARGRIFRKSEDISKEKFKADEDLKMERDMFRIKYEESRLEAEQYKGRYDSLERKMEDIHEKLV